MFDSNKDPEKLTDLKKVIDKERKRLEEYYLWIEEHMPNPLFKEIDSKELLLVARNLLSFPLQDYKATIYLKHFAIVMRLEAPEADVKILKNYQTYGIKKYRAFVSDCPLPFKEISAHLRIAVIYFTEYLPEGKIPKEEQISKSMEKELLELIKENHPNADEKNMQKLLSGMSPRFLLSLTRDRLVWALDMYFKAATRDVCQLQVKYNKDWKKEKDLPSVQIVLAWRNVPKYNFLYRLAKTIHRHGLNMKKVNASFIDPYSQQNVLIMALGLDGSSGKAAWEDADMDEFLRELVTVKYFPDGQLIEEVLVDSGMINGNYGNLLKTLIDFVHQSLVHEDPNRYAPGFIEEALLRHVELSQTLCELFKLRFHPKENDLKKYETLKDQFIQSVDALDTGNESFDTRRKNIFRSALDFIHYTLKTNFYRRNKTAFSFRLDPEYLVHLPFKRKTVFPEIPYGIFFMKGLHYVGFNIRFKDLSRGGLRTIFPKRMEQWLSERNNIFSECYNLAYTQQMKNKDIPEGGAKGVVLLQPPDRIANEEQIYIKELETAGIQGEEMEKHLLVFHEEQMKEYLYQAQRSYVECFLVLLNSNDDGSLKAKDIVDYWQKPEYVYLGPDENMHNVMIEWISDYSADVGYGAGSCFISSKPSTGINHKEYGVTSLGVTVNMEEALKFIGINPEKDPFTIKISGGPDGDVAGNMMLNLHRDYPKTAKLLAIVDVSGTIYDPKGLNLDILVELFNEEKPLRYYPPKKLSEGGFLLDLYTKREESAYAKQTLLWKNEKGSLKELWLSGNEMNHLHRHNIMEVKTDVFIPAGGRPRTLNDTNYKDFLDKSGKPTSKVIVEGANLYLTPWARRSLEKQGVILIKDSTANKGGVICSSYEILTGLCLSNEELLEEKPALMKEILGIIRTRAREEATLLLKTHSETHALLSETSDWISERINTFTYQILDHLQGLSLSNDPKDPLIQALLNYCPATLHHKYEKQILALPDLHKKAIIACYLASRVVYKRGLKWVPTIVDVLPLIASDPEIIGTQTNI